MYRTPAKSMVVTRSAFKREAQRHADDAIAEVKKDGCIEQKSRKQSSTSITRRKRSLELKAAEEKARIEMELIDKRLAADLEDLESQGTLLKELSEPDDREEYINDWLDISQKHLGGLQLPADPPQAAALDTARAPPPTVLPGGTVDPTVHALASAVKDLAAVSAAGNSNMLNRLCTPKELPTYSGDPLQWLEYKRAYDESSAVCNFSDAENLWRLRRSLQGPAKDAVTALLIGGTSPSEVMSTLELQFGNPDSIIARIVQDLHRLRPLPYDYHRDIIPFSIKIKNCVAAVNAIGCQQYLQGTNIVSTVLSKMPTVLLSKWTDYSYPLMRQGTTPQLVILSEFLSEEAIKVTKTLVSVSVHTGFNKMHSVENRKMHHTSLLVNNFSENNNNKCVFCRASIHALYECKRFGKSLCRNRWQFVKRHGYCFKCLKPSHRQDSCSAPKCDIDNCGLNHHRLLHYTKKPAELPISEASTDSNCERVEVVNNVSINNNNKCKVLLKTVPVCLHGPGGSVSTFALLDDGSTVSMISNKLASQLGLRGSTQSMRVRGAWDNSEVICESKIVDLNLCNEKGTSFSIRVRSVNNLNLPIQNMPADAFSDFELLQPEIKNDISNRNSIQCKPELLIGQDNYDLILPLQIIKGKPNEPYLTRTPLGWCVHGCMRSSHNAEAPQVESALHITSASAEFDSDIRDEMRRYFSIDSLGISAKPRENKDEVCAREHLERTAKLVDGRWYVGLPWKDTNCKMPDSYPNAMARLKGVERKMKVNPGYAERYIERINHLFDNDYAFEVNDQDEPERMWYLPHFGVDNPNKKKLRLVFDAAAVSEGMCLNDYIQKGPDMLNSLYGIMFRFREGKIAVSADIRDMFLRIKIREEDRDALRFLWKPSLNEPVKTYAMSSLIFGANCSPFVAQFIRNKNADRYESTMSGAVQAIHKQHFMDDYLDSFNDEQTASKLVNDVTYIHKQGGFEIRDWTSNNQSVLKNSLNNNNLQSAVPLKEHQPYDGERTLGLFWFPTDDMLGYDVSFKKIPANIINGEKIPTKRDILRVLMSIFDVYGFLSPITLTGKIILQDTWKTGINWDALIPEALFIKWKDWINLIKEISMLRLPRYYAAAARRTVVSCSPRTEPPAAATTAEASSASGTNDSSARVLDRESPRELSALPRIICDKNNKLSNAVCYNNLQLHLFTDASTKGMCAVGFWRWTDVDSQVHVAFIASKCKVVPVKYISMPRLELQAAVMGARLMDTIINEHRIKPIKRYLWCDSSTVLFWIRNDARNYKAYIAHRLGEIDELSKIEEWRYIPTKLNVADIATRENCNIQTLQDDWLYGPKFLFENEDRWPQELESQQTEPNDVDLEYVNTLHFTPMCLPTVPDPERFSSWLRLLKSTSAVFTFVNKCRNRTSDADRTLLERAEILLLKYSQMKSFPDDLHHLQQKERLERKSKLLTLTPVLDDNGLIRVGGRIDAASGISSDVKRPVILDGRCHITRLIVKHYHMKACHGNQEMVVNELKQRYWIFRMRPTVKSIGSQCMYCRIRKAQPQPPRMGDLPEARMAHHQRPFTFTGVDLFGPLEVTVGRRREKRYGVIFTCLSVRAIHIEIVSQLTTDALIMALRRMAARRGWPRYIYSDNGTNLRGADTELKKCALELNRMGLGEEVASYSSATTWKFNPPASPHWGGAWERLIRNIKSALRVVLKERAPRDETLHTLMTEVEQMVNGRPLTHVSVDPNTEETLTPNHFLLGASSNMTLPTLGVFDPTDTCLRRQWRVAQQLADSFWRRWVREVLPDLLPRTKWREEQRPLQVGDLVLVVDPNSPRNTWPKGLVHAVLPGRDSRVRVVDVATKTGMLRRSAARVARIAIN